MSNPSEGATQLEVLKRTVAALRSARATIAEHQRRQCEPLALIGAGCRLPGGIDSLQALWALLRESRTAILDIPEGRWPLERYFSDDADAPGTYYARQIGALQDVSAFDAAFFGISPREAAAMDPQQRLLLEVTWEALENAAVDPRTLVGARAGVFVGLSANDYGCSAGQPDRVDIYTATGQSSSVAAGRIAYFLGTHGPALVVDTACSSSLTALHLAVESLRSQECDLAIVAGVNLILTPQLMLGMSKLKALSPTDRCSAFGAAADGYVRGEGCGVVILKRMSDAEAAGDRVLASVVATAVNQDGRSNGLTAPNGAAQEQLLRSALERARITPSQLAFVEAHGTGTKLGDPIELRALDAVLGRDRSQTLWVGSVKSNIGHLEAAAGIVGLLKAVLVVRERAVPANLYADELSPHVPWSNMNLRVPVRLEPLASSGALYAGVSSFGFSGTNAHAIIARAEAAEAAEPLPSASSRPYVLALSARTPAALSALAGRYRQHVSRLEEGDLRDTCFTATARRPRLDEGAVVVADDRDALIRGLECLESDGRATGLLRGRRALDSRGLAFLFSGHGGHWLGMGSQLMQGEPEFRRAVERCSDLLQPRLGFVAAELLRANADSTYAFEERMDVEQPLIFAMQVGLTELWRSRGVTPSFVCGHSLGEVAAAYACGALSLESAARVIAERSLALQDIAGLGGMLAVALEAAELEPMLEEYRDTLCIGAVNGPTTTVLSGELEALQRMERSLRRRGIAAKRVRIHSACHSRQLDPLLPRFRERVGEVEAQDGSIMFVSSVRGAALAGSQLTTEYWVDNLRRSVQFCAATEHLFELGASAFVEIGPSALLIDGLTDMIRRSKSERVAAPSLRRNGDAQRDLLEAAARLHNHGLRIDWSAFGVSGRVVDAPTYPWEHVSYWLGSDWDAQGDSSTRERGLSQVYRQLTSSIDGSAYMEVLLAPGTSPWLSDHRVNGVAVVAGAHFIGAALTAGMQRAGGSACTLQGLRLERSLELGLESAVRLQIAIEDAGTARSFRISSRTESGGPHPNQEWVVHARGEIVSDPSSEAIPATTIAALRARCPAQIAPDALYARYQQRGLQYGRAFRTIVEAASGAQEALARVCCPDAAHDPARSALHPALLDGCFQAVGVLADDESLWVPTSVERFTLLRQVPREVWAHVHGITQDDHHQRADLTLYDAQGIPVAAVEGLVSTRILVSKPAVREGSSTYHWSWHERDLPSRPSASSGAWLILGRDDAIAGAVQLELMRRGEQARLLRIPEALDHSSAPTADWTASVAEELRRAAQPLRGLVVTFASADETGNLHRTLETSGRLLLAIVQTLTAGQPLPGRFWVLTHRAQPVGNVPCDPFQSVLWGLGSAVHAEHPELRTTLVDVDPDAFDASALTTELLADDAERHVALRGPSRSVARLEPLGPAKRSAPRRVPASGRAFRLEIDQPGRLETLALRSCDPLTPQANQVLLRVRAAGLNFADIMLGMGFFGAKPGVGVELGTECSGEVVAVGTDVTRVRVGDRVVCVAQQCIGTFVVADADLVWPLPSSLSDAEGAGLPTAYMTAWYSLVHLAHGAPGERALIHSASGGTGQAACAVARRLGLTVLATAGTEEKRRFLRDQGIDCVMNSRSTEFADEVVRLTQGAGVEIVLNSLSGKAMEANWKLLAPDGHFLELGKRDIYEGGKLALALFKRRFTYTAVDMAGLLRERRARFAQVFAEVVSLATNGELPALPTEVYPVAKSQDAFRRMSAGEHLGKIVLDLSDPATAPIVVGAKQAFAATGVHVISGGLGGLGLELARWLVERGARELLLLGRTAPAPDAKAAVSELERMGAKINTAAVDVAALDDLRAVLDDARRRSGPIRGVFHLAAVLRDGVIKNQSWQRFDEVLRPKALGAWNLHLATLGDPVEHFVMYGSSATCLPSGGQANYAAANAFLSGLAHLRQRQGLPGTTIHWGPFDNVGLTASPGMAHSEWRRQGIEPLQVADSHQFLMTALEHGLPVCAHVSLAAREWIDAHPQLAELPIYSALDAQRSGAAADAQEWSAKLRAAEPEAARGTLLALVMESLSAALGTSHADVPSDVPFSDLGISSLAALEVKNRLSWALSTTLPDSVLWAHPTAATLADYLAKRFGPEEVSA
jgi:acyl transferase domain-containing protein/NADPH:quinone reductase-like Zn-dependent oxidoreductase/NAD(P)-dependent dehydrogenase (short-subunit alcohol dehydrogenase family)/acyl carrier protein